MFNHNYVLSFTIDLTDSGAKVQKADASASPLVWEDVTGSVTYEGDGYKYVKSDDYIAVGTQVSEDAQFVVKDYYRILTDSTKTNYRFDGKWMVGTAEVGTDPVAISGNTAFTAKMQIALTFKIYDRDTADPAIGHVINEDETTVTVA